MFNSTYQYLLDNELNEEGDSNQMIENREDTGSASNAQEQKKGRQNVMILVEEFDNFSLKKTSTDFNYAVREQKSTM